MDTSDLTLEWRSFNHHHYHPALSDSDVVHITWKM